MQKEIKGIVLSKIKYGENSMIVNIFTKEFGKMGFVVHKSKSRKNHSIRYLQPMYILDMQTYIKPQRNLQNIKEIQPAVPIKNLSLDFNKIAICQFIAELVNKTQREGETDEVLFNFLTNIIQLLDETDQKTSNFAIFFIIKYSRFLGLQIHNNYSETNSILDFKAGRFIMGHPQHPHFADFKTSNLIHQIMTTKFTEMHLLNIKSKDRNYLIDLFIKYFNFHLNKPGKLNSLVVLQEVFYS